LNFIQVNAIFIKYRLTHKEENISLFSSIKTKFFRYHYPHFKW